MGVIFIQGRTCIRTKCSPPAPWHGLALVSTDLDAICIHEVWDRDNVIAPYGVPAFAIPLNHTAGNYCLKRAPFESHLQILASLAKNSPRK